MELSTIVVIVALHLTGFVSAYVTPSPAATIEAWTDAGNIWKHVALPHSSGVSRLAHEILQDPRVNLSTSCRSSLTEFSQGLIYGDERAYKILDSFAKFRSGFLENQRFVDFGHYDQCLDQKGRYVLLNIHFPLPASRSFGQLKHATHQANSSGMVSMMSSSYLLFYTVTPLVGVCFPELCSQHDVHNIIESDLITKFTHPLRLEVVSTEADTDEDRFPDHKLLRLISQIVILWLISMMLIGTYFPSQHFLLKHFDAKRNREKLFQESSNPRLNFFNGYKVCYLLTAIFGHLIIPITPSLHPFTMEIIHYILKTSFYAYQVKSAFSVVATNFMISASLSVVSWLPEIEKKKGRLSVVSFLFLRAIRTLPVTIFCMLIIYSFPLVSFRAGPLMNHIQKNLTGLCIENGWKDLIFVANTGNPVYNCSAISWYASADFQLYALSFFTLILLYKKPKLGIYFTFFQIFAGIIIQGFVIWYYDVSPSITMFYTNDSQRMSHIFRTIYVQAYNNISVYAIGILLGYAIVKDVQIPEKWTKFCWILSTTLFLGSVILPGFLFDGLDFVGSRFWEIVVGAFFKIGPSAGLAGLLFLCWVQPDSWLAKVLGAKSLAPIARLSYSAFMTHSFLIIFLMGIQREPFYMSHMEVTTKVLFICITSMPLAYFTYITVEAPFFNLVKELASPKKLTQEASNNNNGLLDKNSNLNKKQE